MSQSEFGFAERYREWMRRAAPGIIKGYEWVTRERQATMTTGADGRKPIEYGFLPAGGLEDVQDFWYWLGANAATVWGFDAAAAAIEQANLLKGLGKARG